MTTQPQSFRTMRLLAALSLSLVFGLARAQDTETYETDPPDRAARLSYLQGDVSMQPAGEDDWAPAILNRPLTTGDKLWTEEGARAEIYVGPAAVRLGSDTGFSFLNVDDDTIQMRMTAGVINVSVRDLGGNDHIEVDTPNVAVSLLRPGNYRVEVNDAGDTTVVRISEGEAEASGIGQNVIVHAQQSATFRGTDQVVAQFGSLGSPDEFDSWALARERRDDEASRSRSAQYVAPDVTGYEDLDDNGSWSNEPEYGYVWTPSRVAVDWSPYRYGRWVYVGPWGWTWIDDAPWGYAPFHYGRWAHVRERWCWVPGPRHVRAVYAPALVGWVGSPGVSVSVSIGSGVGWFPLGPREVYVPARRFSPRYVERVNVRNTVIVNRTTIVNVYNGRGGPVTYRNRGALTSVSRTTFTSSQRVGDHRIRMSETEIDRTRVTAAPPRIDPSRESRFGGSTRVVGRAPPRTVVDRQVVVNRPPPTSSARYTRPRTDARGNFDTRTRSENERGSNERGSNEPIVRDRPDRPAMQRERPIDRQVGGTNPPAGAQPNGKHVDDDPRADGRPQQRERPIDRQSGATELRTQETPRNERPDRPPREQLDRHQQDRQQRERDNGPDQPREVNTRPNWQRSNDQPREQRPQMEQRPVEPRQIEQRQVEQRQRAPEQRERPIERNVERPRSENRQENRPEPRQENRQENRQESRPPRNESRPAESRPPKQRDDQPKPNRN